MHRDHKGLPYGTLCVLCENTLCSLWLKIIDPLFRKMKKYIRISETISGRLSDELVMLDLQKGKYFSLNNVATRIWDLLENPMDIDEMCLILDGEYEVNRDQCRKEVREYIDEMIRLGLVKEQE